ncbi:uncharacterized protein LOC117197156 isoform X41 [Orcinus orca]|uniref:uncharacterized protein LOC117197156 isoform X41 n=1 Tax=Orcinus orca TaxID=9733 RepID=UPI0021129CB5|nr:uncharacterized protein LOC117197156 isoform X41 [Orcinus orca]
MPSRAAVQHPGSSPPPLACRAPCPGTGVMLWKALLLLSACFALAVTYPALLQEFITDLESTTVLESTTDPESTTGLDLTTGLQWTTGLELTTGPESTTGLESTTDLSDLTTHHDFTEDAQTTTDVYLENTQTFELPTNVGLNTLSSKEEATEVTEEPSTSTGSNEYNTVFFV